MFCRAVKKVLFWANGSDKAFKRSMLCAVLQTYMNKSQPFECAKKTPKKPQAREQQKSREASSSGTNKAHLVQFLLQRHLLRQIITNHINNRVQEFSDPITSTLILMATSPLQIVFCDEGLVLFKTTHLPIFPYSMLKAEDRKFLLDLLHGLEEAQTQESYHGCGKFSVQVYRGNYGFLPKKDLLLAFVDIMMHQIDFKDKTILQRLSDIIIQRFLSAISVHSDDIAVVMDSIWGTSSLPHHEDDDEEEDGAAGSI